MTGATGFIGTALCKRLLEEGLSVHGTVRFLDPSILPRGVAPVQLESIEKKGEWETILNDTDTVVHLAARVHAKKDSASNPFAEYRKVNVMGSERLALTAAEFGVKRFIFMSSAKVNGERTEGKSRGQRSEVRGQGSVSKQFFSEEDVPEPQDPYAVSKWEAEQVLHKNSDETGMELVVLRPPLVYGPGVKANFLKLMKIVDKGTPLPLAKIDNRRSFIYIENLVDAVLTCIKHSGSAGQTYFVSDNEDVSTPELIRKIASALKKPARLFPLSLIHI